MGVSKRNSVVVLVALAILATACGGGGKSAKAEKKKEAKERTARAAAIKAKLAPLTGLPDKAGAALKRPVVTVKVNNLEGKPHSGIDKADVVYEEVVEGGITRLAAMFNSHAPDRVGPVRSVRRTDQTLVWPVGGVFAYSGGAQYAVDSINEAPVTQLDESRAGSMMYRDDSDEKPYNLWAHVDQMYDVKGAEPVPPPALFKYRAPKAKVSGAVALAVTVGFSGGYAATFTWDKKTGTWLRSRFDAPDVEQDGTRLAPKNVVVLFVNYAGGAGNEGSEAELTGTGDAWVFTAGKVIKGHWTRENKDDPEKLTNATGAEIRLTPGQTWVELPDKSYPVTTFP